MLIKKMAVLTCMLVSATAFTQTNFSYSPQNPKAGDLITIEYEPGGDIAATTKPVEAKFYMLGNGARTVQPIATDELKLVRNGKKYTTTLQTDTAANFIYFGFSADGKFDNNDNNGYYILFSEDGKIRKGAYGALSGFYQQTGGNVGIASDNEKALAALEKEMSLYPEDRNKQLGIYLRLMRAAKKPDVEAVAQKEIESLIKAGLKTEDDYQTLSMLYYAAKLPEQEKFITSVMKEKFPQGKWTITDYMQKFYAESDPVKSQAMADELMNKIKTDPKWKDLEPFASNYQLQPLYLYQRQNDWQGFKKAVAGFSFPFEANKASLYNTAAWEMQKTGTDLKTAEMYSSFATEWAKNEMLKPTGEKPKYITTQQWNDQRKANYAMFADTYGMIMYKMGDYKKGWSYSKEAALTINKGKDPDLNNTYALLAEKILTPKQFKKELEKLVRIGNINSDTRDMLKKLYVKENGGEAGFDDYMTTLGKEQYLKMMEELRKSMLTKTAPSFALYDLDGNKITTENLKGKVVVADFWATWCGPCKASFPAMEKMVAKYKNNPDVKFVFIDTWERVDDKKKNAADFITKSKYSFHVLLDNENKVVEQFNIDGIPTKFVIDKNGVIRFKSVGFNGNDDKLIDELTAMIDIAAQQSKVEKTF